MPSDTRTHSSNQEALLLDQALDAVNQRLHSFHQPLAIAHTPNRPAPNRPATAWSRPSDGHASAASTSMPNTSACRTGRSMRWAYSRPYAPPRHPNPPPTAPPIRRRPRPMPVRKRHPRPLPLPPPLPHSSRTRQRSGNDQTVPRIPGKARAAAFRPDAHRRHQESARNPGSPALTAASGRNTARPPRYGRGRPDEGDRRQPTQVPPESVMTRTVHRIAQAAVVADISPDRRLRHQFQQLRRAVHRLQRYRPLGAGGPEAAPGSRSRVPKRFPPASCAPRRVNWCRP